MYNDDNDNYNYGEDELNNFDENNLDQDSYSLEDDFTEDEDDDSFYDDEEDVTANDDYNEFGENAESEPIDYFADEEATEDNSSEENTSDVNELKSPYLNNRNNVSKKTPAKSSPLSILLLVLLLVLAGVMGFTYFNTGTVDITQLFNQQASTVQQDSQTIEDAAITKEGDNLFDAAVKNGAKNNPDINIQATNDNDKNNDSEENSNTESPSNSKDIEKTLVSVKLNKGIVIPVKQSGRKEPFYPIGFRRHVEPDKVIIPATPVEVPETTFNPDYVEPAVKPAYSEEDLKSIMAISKITVSGIMYDPKDPSAIIRHNDVDYFVHKGDKCADFTVKNISRKAVQLQNGSNTYTAELGHTTSIAPEEFTSSKVKYETIEKMMGKELVPSSIRQSDYELHVNPISNIDKKFGGAYNKSHKQSIMINEN